MSYHTHALPGGKQGGDADEQTEKRERPPPTIRRAEGDDDAVHDAGDDAGDTQAAGKGLSGLVAVADGPADEVGVGLVPERPFDGGNDVAERRRVRGDGEGLQEHGLFLGREIEQSRSPVGDVDGDDSRHLLAEGLDGNYTVVSLGRDNAGRDGLVQGNRAPASSKAVSAFLLWSVVPLWRVVASSL